MSNPVGNVEFWKASSSFAWPLTARPPGLLFRRFDVGLLKRDQMTIKVAGIKISVAQATKQGGTALSDLQERVAALESRTPTQARPAHEPSARSGAQHSILWVDDFPTDNAFLIEKLESDGIRVRKEISTDAALRALGNDSFDIIISDLGRIENGRDNPFAGLELARALKASNSATPLLIFAGSRGLEHRDQLLTAGATDVTSSPIDVFRFIETHLVKAT